MPHKLYLVKTAFTQDRVSQDDQKVLVLNGAELEGSEIAVASSRRDVPVIATSTSGDNGCLALVLTDPSSQKKLVNITKDLYRYSIHRGFH